MCKSTHSLHASVEMCECVGGCERVCECGWVDVWCLCRNTLVELCEEVRVGSVGVYSCVGASMTGGPLGKMAGGLDGHVGVEMASEGVTWGHTSETEQVG